MKNSRRHWTAVASVVIGATIGLLAASELNNYLRIGLANKDVPPWESAGEAGIGEGVPPREGPSEEARPLPFRMVDLGAVGIEADSANWGDSYSHNSGRFAHVLSRSAPYIDRAAAEIVYDEFDRYARRMVAMDYNAIEFGGFLGHVDFDSVGSGLDVYPDAHPIRGRQEAIRSFHRPMFERARELGMEVFFRTDMVSLSEPLDSYLESRSLDVNDDAFWAVYQAGLAELFIRHPEVKGIIIRIGEAGAVFNQSGSDYRSEIRVRDADALHRMLEAFLDVAARYDRTIVFRTWTVGIGDIGDLHTNPATYDRVLGPIDHANLIVSTKITAGDFWSHLPFNTTLETGHHRRIVELQARREFEAFNVVPNYVGSLYQGGIERFVAANPNIEGVWVWTQGGGPLRRGPMMLYPFVGTWEWTDANVYAASRTAIDPGGNPTLWARDWGQEWLGADDTGAEAIAEVLRGSHRTLAEGLTIPEFARLEVRGLGLEIPPVLYSYWDIVDGSTALGSHLHTALKSDVGSAIEATRKPVEEVRAMRSRISGVQAGASSGRLRASIDYEVNLLETLSQHKRWVIQHYDWLARGGTERRQAERTSARLLRIQIDAHQQAYSGNLDYPSYNFSIVDRALRQANSAQMLRLVSLVLLLVVVVVLRFASGGLALVWLTVVWSVFAAAQAPAFSALAAFTASIACVTTGILARGDRDIWRRLMLPVLPLPLLLCATMAWRGPVFAWYLLWTSDTARVVFCVVVGITAFLRSRAWVLSGGRRGVAIGLGGVSIWLFVVGGLMAVLGLESFLTTMNEELLVLPGMLSRVLGIATYLEIPLGLWRYWLAAGFATGIVALLAGATTMPEVLSGRGLQSG